jgi:hypothetical protein
MPIEISTYVKKLESGLSRTHRKPNTPNINRIAPRHLERNLRCTIWHRHSRIIIRPRPDPSFAEIRKLQRSFLRKDGPRENNCPSLASHILDGLRRSRRYILGNIDGGCSRIIVLLRVAGLVGLLGIPLWEKIGAFLWRHGLMLMKV